MPVKKTDDSQAKKPAARKTTKTAAKKTAENKTVKKTTRKTAVKTDQAAEMAMIAAEEKKGAEIVQAIDALGEKAAEKKTEAEMNAIAAETEKGAAIEAAVEKMEEGQETAAPAKKTRKTAAKPAAKKKASAKKAAPSNEAVMEEIKDEAVKGAKIIAAEAAMEEAQEQKAELNAIAAEAEKGAAIEEAIAKTEEAKPVKKTARKTAAKTTAKKTAKKAAAKAEEKPAEKAESAPSEKEELAMIAEEARKGAEIIAAESKVKPEPAEAAIEAVEKEIAAETEKGAGIEQAIADLGKKAEAAQVKEAQEEALKEEKTEEKPEAKEEESVQEEVKKAPELTEEKKNFYATFSDQTLLDMANAMGLGKSLDELKAELQQTVDIAGAAAAKMAELPKANDYVFEEDGFDASVVPVLYERVADSLPYRASDRKEFADRITADIARPLVNEGMNDSAIYKDLMRDVREILMFAQHNNITSWQTMKEKVPADLDHLLGRFMDVAYTMLPGWQYNDVKYYEGFLYGVLSQFEDLSNWHNRAMMDVADLYIKHGDFGKGDADYRYIIRENTLKDQIYYRFASVYLPIDLQKAKAVASDALQYVDGRFEYYPKIMEILNR